ncbi:hypothetical protein COLO4_16321 [Corchorus olitorius]|uniref:Uncharacterized protein n=1 Tax=Corchorus olitorius TaxID=93759 RepID=A0A1R3JHZ6_9ROSI|nr:hypothetical protein COLO4_16321 [Corchorus olitorius]
MGRVRNNREGQLQAVYSTYHHRETKPGNHRERLEKKLPKMKSLGQPIEASSASFFLAQN